MDGDIPRTSRLLVFRGIAPHQFGIAVIAKLEVAKPAEHTFDTIPAKFTTVEMWPKTTNLKCWVCDRIPKSYPRFVATNPSRDTAGNDVCDPVGNFCSWVHSAAYIEDKYPASAQPDLMYLLTIFEAKFTGRRREKIFAPLGKTCQRQYGGGMTEEQYAEYIDSLESKPPLTQYKFEHFCVKL